MKDIIIHAIDIGTTKVAAIVARKTENDKIEILGIGNSPSYGVRRANVINIDKTVEAIKLAVEQAEKQSGIPFKSVYVGIAGQHIRSLQHRGILMRKTEDEEISEDDIKRLIEDMRCLSLPPGERIIEIVPQDFIVDNFHGIKDPVGMLGNRLEGNFHIITGASNCINTIKRSIERAGLEVADIFLQPLASAAATLSKQELEAGVVLVDIGGGTTDIALFEDGIIRHTAVIPWAGEAITDDIKQGCLIMREHAEDLKKQYGTAVATDEQENISISIPGVRDRQKKEISVKNLSYIIQARVEEILENVLYEIKSSRFDKKLLAGIVLTGGGSQLKHIIQLTELVTGIEARKGLPNEYLAPSKINETDNPIFATGIGLILKALKDYKPTESVIKAENSVDKADNVEINKSDNKKKKLTLGLNTSSNSNNEENHEGSLKNTWTKKIMTWFKQDIEKDFEDL